MKAQHVVLVEYFTTSDTTLLFITRQGFQVPQVEEVKTSREDIYQFILSNLASSGGITSRKSRLHLEALQSRLSSLVEPILRWSDEGDIIWLVPHDLLHYMPLHALKVSGRYLIERNPVCYTPSSSMMQFCQKNRKGRRKYALVVGDSRNDLPNAREEALSITELFAAQLYLQRQATKTLIVETLARQYKDIDILHFSCHGYFNTNRPLKSGIMLAPKANSDMDQENDGQWNLTAEEIFSLKIEADLVTLSACETGINDRKPGDELIGLTRALIYAGTPSVVVSLWAVDDLSTSLLMQHFYLQLQNPDEGQPVSKCEALQSAQLYVKNLTAQQVVNYCNQRLAKLHRPEDEELRLSLLLELARAQITAADLAAAIEGYRNVQNRLDTLDSKWARRIIIQVRDTLDLLEFSAMESSSNLAVNYEIKPFELPYYWAPFILVGDWK